MAREISGTISGAVEAACGYLLRRTHGIPVAVVCREVSLGVSSVEFLVALRSDPRVVFLEGDLVQHRWCADISGWSDDERFFMPTAPWSRKMAKFVMRSAAVYGLHYSASEFSVKKNSRLNLCSRKSLLALLLSRGYTGINIREIFCEYPCAYKDIYDMIVRARCVFFDGTQIWWSAPEVGASARGKRRKILDSGAVPRERADLLDTGGQEDVFH